MRIEEMTIKEIETYLKDKKSKAVDTFETCHITKKDMFIHNDDEIIDIIYNNLEKIETTIVNEECYKNLINSITKDLEIYLFENCKFPIGTEIYEHKSKDKFIINEEVFYDLINEIKEFI